MVTQLKALVLVLIFTGAGFFFFQRPFAAILGAPTVTRWRNLWIAVTIALFLIPNFWLFVLAMTLIIIAMMRNDPLKPAIYFLLLFSVPAFGDAIPGFAGINKFIMVTPMTVLNLVILFPLLLSATAMKKPGPGGGGSDLFFYLYAGLIITLSVRAPTFTHMLRSAIESAIFLAPIYLVFSRAPKTLDDIRTISAAFTLSALLLAIVCIPEFFRNWHLYVGASEQWFGARAFTYTMREGHLRTSSAVTDPIVWGTICMTAIGLGLALFTEKFTRTYRNLAFGLLLFGLIVTFSRGPWIGAIATAGVFFLLSPRAPQRLMQFGAAGLAAFVISLATPFGRTVVSLLPFVGDSATETISYRTQLLEAAREVMAENPILGTSDYLENPKFAALRQGQGIIDIVNSYLEIGLKSGFVGLALFIGFFASVLLSLWGAMRRARRHDAELFLYCRAYFAVLVGMLLTIFTTSSVLQIPYVYWALGGIAIALVRIERARFDNPQGRAEDPVAITPAAPKFDWK